MTHDTNAGPAADEDRGTSEPAASAATPAGRPGPWSGLKPLLLRLHFYVGVFVAPFIAVAAITGLLYTATPQLEQVVHGHQLRVEPGPGSVPLADQIRTATAAVPEGTLVAVRPPKDDRATTRVIFTTPQTDAEHTRTAFIDPHSGELRGVLTTYGEWLPVRSFVDSLHRTLLLGDVGRVYSELAASWLWVLALSGLALWLGRKRRRRRHLMIPRRRGSRRARTLGWHGSMGVWLAVGMLFLSATGLTWSQFAGANVSALRAQLNWRTPSVSAPAELGAPVPTAQLPATYQRLDAVAQRAGLGPEIEIAPGEPGGAWTVSQVKRSFPLQQDSIAVDPTSGEVLSRVDFADWPLAAQLAEAGISGHMGLLFGLANQVLLAALAIGILALVVWGWTMWWRRRPPLSGVVPPEGHERRLHLGACLVVAIIGAAVAVLAPVLGASLLIFLVIDLLRGSLVTRRPRPTTVDVGEARQPVGRD